MERELANISDFNAIVDYAEIFASFIGDFIDVRSANPRPRFLDPKPAKSYGGRKSLRRLCSCCAVLRNRISFIASGWWHWPCGCRTPRGPIGEAGASYAVGVDR
jgi:hypothetical protein